MHENLLKSDFFTFLEHKYFSIPADFDMYTEIVNLWPKYSIMETEKNYFEVS